MRLSAWSFIVAVIALVLIVQLASPAVHAMNCGVQINSVNYPLKVTLGQNIDVTARLTATCTQSAIPISGRADLIDTTVDQAISIGHFFIGYIPEAHGRKVNATVSQAVHAPSLPGIWQLRLEVRLSVGEGTTVVGFAEQPVTILIGEIGQTATSLQAPLNQSLGGSMTQVYVQISSNSTIADLHFDQSRHLINFTASGPPQTSGLTLVVFAKDLIRGAPVVIVDNGNVSAAILSLTSNSTDYLLAFAYPHSAHAIAVGGSDTIAEFDVRNLLIELPILIAASATVVRSKRSSVQLKR